MLGKIIGSREIAARWSFVEITGRFASAYIENHRDPASVALIGKIKNGASFESLAGAEREQLAVWFDTGFRADFANALNGWYRSFRCESWTNSRLAEMHTLPAMDPLGQYRSLTFVSYLAHPRKRLPNGEPDPRNPAVAADAIPNDVPFIQLEPLIAGHWDDGTLMIWEGNLRAVLFLRAADPKDQILVWVPHEGSWPADIR